MVQSYKINGFEPPAILTSIGLFAGRSANFDVNWYPNAGVGIILTMLINVFVPHIGPFMSHISMKFARYWSKNSNVMQRELNCKLI